MDIEKQKIFDAFMEAFVDLDTVDKNKEIIEKQKNIIAYLLNYLTINNIDYNLFKSREINDVLEGNCTNDDYIEAIMVYTHNIEELVGILINNR